MLRAKTLNKKLGPYLKQRRQELGLTQQEICRELGFSAQFWGRIEKGEVGCPENAFLRLITILEIKKNILSQIYKAAVKDEVANLFKS